MANVYALALADLPLGSIKEVELEDETVLLLHLEKGIYAVNGICTHARVHLSGGHVENGATLCCSQHGGKFDIATGKAVALPVMTALATYPVTVQAGGIYVEIEA